MTKPENCPLCANVLEGEIVRTAQFVIVQANEPLFPGFTRVVWRDHVAEMTQLSDRSRRDLMQAVFDVECIMRDVLAPNKVNLASLGNQVPHLHWHIIGRWADDATFPASVWSPATITTASDDRVQATLGLLNDYHDALRQHFQTNHDHQ